METYEKQFFEHREDPIKVMTRKICKQFDVSPDTLSMVRTHVGAKQEDIVLTRQVFVYYSVRYLTAFYGFDKDSRPEGWHQTKIYNKVAGFVNRDRATIIHSLKMIDNYLFSDRRMRAIIADMDTQFKIYLSAINTDVDMWMLNYETFFNQKIKPNEENLLNEDEYRSE
jgi:hypothetical protein